ncbi:tyrosine-type recombinase/integrase [Acuticoccus sp.]|uniref:tyrosine-type recombinase/integrase n=1 Tax=Acuticoccus sp. TaxID=1904378 RepID=UPI003B516100
MPNDLAPLADAALLVERARWLSDLTAVRGRAKHSAEAYERDTRQFLAFLASHLGAPADMASLRALRPADVRAFLAARRAAGAGPRTLARNLAGVRALLTHLERAHGVSAAPARAVGAPARPRALPRPVQEEAARRMLEPGTGWISLRDAAVLALLYGCGLRVGEATGLDAADVPEPLVRLRVTGKGDRTREVPVLPAVAAAVACYRAAAPFALEGGPLFRGERGGRLSPRTVQRTVEAWRRALGLPASATPHALRHAFASHLLARGADLRAIQELLGHARLSTTEVYTAVEPTRLFDAWRDAHPRATPR